MQIFYGIVVLLSCIICTLPPGHVAQQGVVRHDCPLLQRCNTTDTDVVCATNGQSCKLFNSDCELQRENCNKTLATAWNRTASIQCTNIHTNITGLCACSTQSLDLECSNQTITTGICAHGGLGYRVRLCHLFQTECDLRRAHCNREEWHTIDNRQCRGFGFNQTNPCICPKMLQCSRNRTQHCVQVSARGCRLYATECDVERQRCDGERLEDVDMQQCRNIQVGQSGICHCPGLFHCQRNNTNICVRNAEENCRLMGNECDVEQIKCDGSDLITVHDIQCSSLRPNETGTCHCPALESCSLNRTNICVETQTGCELKRNECELELSRCSSDELRNTSSLQCLGFQPGERKPCTCPKLKTCARNTTNICARTTQGCILIQNECALEEEVCKGSNLTIVDGVQCRGGEFTHNQLRNCSCPNLDDCDESAANICVAVTSDQCRLLQSPCDLEKAKCEGQNLTIVNSLHCRNFTADTTTNCSCPSLLHCKINSNSICVRQQNNHCQVLRNNCELEQAQCEERNISAVSALHCQNFQIGDSKLCMCPKLFNCSSVVARTCIKVNNSCTLLRSKCDLEREICRGNDLKIVSPLHCSHFEFGQPRNCSCPKLETCSRNSTSRCIKTGNTCKLVRNECEMEELKCQGQSVTVLPNVQCKLLTVGQNGSCWCPRLINCRENSSQVCAETPQGCRLLRNNCDLEQLKCLGENAIVTNMIQCQHLRIDQVKACACPRLKTCSRNNRTIICVRGRRGCMRMAHTCDLEIAKCRGENWALQNAAQCRNFAIGYIGRCTCPMLNNCSRGINRNYCFQKGTQCKSLRNQCEVERSRCLREGFTATIQHRCQGIRRGTTAMCRCPELRRCDRRRIICANNGQQCKLFRNDCELKRAICQGGKWRRSAQEVCCQLRVNETKNCSFSSESAICGKTSNQICRLFTSRCEFNAVNAKSRRNFTVVNRSQCKCVGARRTGRCTAEPTCVVPEGRTRQICARFRNTTMWFNSQCQLRQHNYRTCRSGATCNVCKTS